MIIINTVSFIIFLETNHPGNLRCHEPSSFAPLHKVCDVHVSEKFTISVGSHLNSLLGLVDDGDDDVWALLGDHGAKIRLTESESTLLQKVSQILMLKLKR